MFGVFVDLSVTTSVKSMKPICRILENTTLRPYATAALLQNC